MRFVRLFLAWLLLAAIPLQGLAAAAMQCQERAAQGAAHVHAPSADPGHGHGAHAFDGHAAAGAHDEAAPAGSHGCANCAAACHAPVITASPSVLPLASPAGQLAADPVFLIVARSPLLPDKPPRA